MCRNLSDGQKRSELTVERRREYNKKQRVLLGEFISERETSQT